MVIQESTEIIRMLWAAVYDLLLICHNGEKKKTVREVERDLEAIECLCRPYAIDEDWEPP